MHVFVRPIRLYPLLLYLLGAVPRYNAEFGEGTGPIVLQDILCEGTEQRLVDCRALYDGYSTSYCSHSYDAGVVCETGDFFHFHHQIYAACNIM